MDGLSYVAGECRPALTLMSAALLRLSRIETQNSLGSCKHALGVAVQETTAQVLH